MLVFLISLMSQIIGDPSKKLADEMAKEEKERVRKQQEVLGEDGLKKKGEILKNAIEQNEVIQFLIMLGFPF